MRKKILLVHTITMICLFLTAHISAQLNLDAGFNAGVTDASTNNFYTAVQPDGKILVGGSFSFVNGAAKTGIVRLNADGTLDSSFNPGGNGTDGDVIVVKIVAGGKILIGGSFTKYNGVTVSKQLMRLNADGTADATFNVGGTGVDGAGGRVHSLAIQPDGKIIVGNQGGSGYNGNVSNGFFRLNADGSFDNTLVSGFSTNVSFEKVDVQPDGKILLCGYFGFNGTTYGGNPINNLIRVTATGALDTNFPIGGDGGSDSCGGFGLQPDGKIVIGGDFTAYNGTPRSLLARVNSNGTLDTSFVPPTLAGGFVEDVEFQTDGKIIAVGSLKTSFGLTTNAVMRLNSNGSQDTSLNGTADAAGYAAAIQSDGKILVPGFFTKISGSTKLGLARFNAGGSLDTSFNPAFTQNGFVNAMVKQTDGKTIVGGSFRNANGNLSVSLARFNVDGSFDSSFNVGTGIEADPNYATKDINALAVQTDGKILVGGWFGGINGVERQGILRLNADGSLDTSFTLSGNINPFILIIHDLLILPDGKIIIGGIIRNNSNQVRGLLRLNSNGSIDETFNAGNLGANNRVYSIARQTDGKLLIGGSFTTYNGTNRPRFARINADGSLDTTFNVGTGANSTVYKVVLQPDGKGIIGGAFTSYNGATANRIARANADGSLDTSFNGGAGASSDVRTIALQSDGKILIGGVFGTYNGITRPLFARLNSDGSLDASVTSGFNTGSVNSIIAEPGGKVIIGGSFSSYNGTSRNNILRLTNTTSRTSFDFDGDGKSDISVFRPSNGAWYIQQSANGFTGLVFGNGTDIPVPADYDGDGKIDVAVFRPVNGGWYYLRSSDNAFVGMIFGQDGDVPRPADYDGDGKADINVFRPSGGAWYRTNSSNNSFSGAIFGQNGDQPLVADFDGDGRADLSVFRPSDGAFYSLNSSNGMFRSTQFGFSTDIPTPADFDGDGKTDIAVFRPSNGAWYRFNSSTGAFFGTVFGQNGDVPVAADYDGDGKSDIAVFRPSAGAWYYTNSSNNAFAGLGFGLGTDKPIPAAFQ